MTSSVAAAQVHAGYLEVAWRDREAPAHFPWMWLRDNCPCEACLHPDTAQRQVDTPAIPAGIAPDRVDVENAGGAVRVRWPGDGHESRFPAELLARAASARLQPPAARTLWEAAAMDKAPPVVAFQAVMEGDQGLKAWLEAVARFGFCFVRGVPATPEETRRLAGRVAYIRESVFGGFWDFTANMAHGDTAYTNLELRPHTDGTYCLDPPGLQMFHCLSFDGGGGESVLVDGFRAAAALREKDPDAFDVLARVKVPARYIEPGVHLRAAHPVIGLDSRGELRRICFNNYDREPFLLPPGEMDAFYRALRAFDGLLRSSELALLHRLEPGEVLLFDNWRVLHGRRAYTGSRRLAGCYFNREDFESRLRTLRQGA